MKIANSEKILKTFQIVVLLPVIFQWNSIKNEFQIKLFLLGVGLIIELFFLFQKNNTRNSPFRIVFFFLVLLGLLLLEVSRNN